MTNVTITVQGMAIRQQGTDTTNPSAGFRIPHPIHFSLTQACSIQGKPEKRRDRSGKPISRWAS